MTAKTRAIIVEVCSTALILLFVYASVSKLAEYERYVRSINNQPFDDRFTMWIVWGLPTAELLTVLLLAVPKWRNRGFLCSLLLMVMFTVYIGLILGRVFGKIPCSCGGVLNKLDWDTHLYFNLIFVALSLLGYLLTRPAKPSDNMSGHQFSM